MSGQLPAYLNGKHFSPDLIRFILYQYFHCHVTQPLLIEQLHEFEIQISKGQLSNILIEEKDRFHREKDQILSTGLESLKLGHGGDTYIASLLDMDPHTVARGRQELISGDLSSKKVRAEE